MKITKINDLQRFIWRSFIRQLWNRQTSLDNILSLSSDLSKINHQKFHYFSKNIKINQVITINSKTNFLYLNFF